MSHITNLTAFSFSSGSGSLGVGADGGTVGSLRSENKFCVACESSEKSKGELSRTMCNLALERTRWTASVCAVKYWVVN